MSEISETIETGGSGDNEFPKHTENSDEAKHNTSLHTFETPQPQLLTGPSQVGPTHGGLSHTQLLT